MKKTHYAWFVCLGCAMILFCTSGLAINAFTVYQPYILKLNGFTNAQTSSIITVRSLFAFLSMFLTGFYYQRLSYRAGLAGSGMMMAFAFLLFGLAKSYAAYCIAAATAGLAYGVGTMIPITILLERWFVQKRTLAIGICSASTGLSTLGIPSLITALIEKTSLRTAFVSEAGLIALLAAGSFLLLRSDPSQKQLEPYGQAGTAGATGKKDASSERFLPGKTWVLLVPMLLFLGAVTSTGYSHLSVLANGEGFPPQTVALAITVSGLALTGGKLLYGALTERIGIRCCNWLFGILMILGLVLLCTCTGSTALLMAGMLLYGCGLAFTTVGMTAWALDLSAPEQQERTVRYFQIGHSGGGLLFSSLPGILADRFGGSYVPAYLFFIFCALFVLLTIQGIYRRSVY